MNDPMAPEPSGAVPPVSSPEDHSPWASSIYRLCEEIIALREMNNRQHRLFEQALTRSRDAVQASFNSFAADTQRAYQQLRQELQGEKRLALTLLHEILEVGLDLERIVSARPDPEDAEGLARWAEAVEVESRKVQAALQRHGIHPYHAVLGSAYNPALHERVGSRRTEGMDPLRIAEQREPGYASQQPEFVLRRPKVIVSE
ncbi:MAG: nucleotide exchange factor GrpE [Planctomycetes bacterium]|nr:nucleotide exchange factor GrpE [Planctomycetota bacterium]